MNSAVQLIDLGFPTFSLPLRWVIFIAFAAAFLGASWRLQLIADKDGADGPSARGSAVARMFSHFTFFDWCVVLMGLAYLIPLVLDTAEALF